MTSEDSREPSPRTPWRFAGLGTPNLVGRRDFLLATELVAGYLATFVIPRRADPWLAERFTAAFMRLRSKNVTRTEETIRRALGPRAESIDLGAAVRSYYAGKFESAVGRVRGMHPRAWNPEIEVEVEGREYVEEALKTGRGAILWRMNMGDTMHLQHGAWQNGWPLVQLSASAHGVGHNRFAYRVAAPLYARPENPYLAERVVIPADWSFGYLPKLVRTLEANQLVAILGEIVSRQNVMVPLFEGFRAVPTGAVAIAHRTGAALIPAATIREGRWKYRIQLGPPIEVDRSLPRRLAVEEPAREFGRRLESAIAEHPGDYNGWWVLRYTDSRPDGDSPLATVKSD